MQQPATSSSHASARIEAPASPAPPPSISRGYMWTLLALLMSATVFDGYDSAIFHLCTPYIAQDFGLDDRAIGLMATIVRIGGLLSFFVLMLADRIGRRPVATATVLFYTLFTLFTALSTGLASFTLFQSGAQVFLMAELSIAIIIISEEFPEDARGRGVAMLHVASLIGVIGAGVLFGYMAETQWGWRGLYLIGIAPLLLVSVLRRKLRETQRFEALRTRLVFSGSLWADIGSTLRQALAPLKGPYRNRVLLVAALWNSLALVGMPSVTFFSLFARRDRGWSAPAIGFAVTLSYVIGTTGHLLGGYLLDKVGRKATTSISYVAGGVFIFLLYHLAEYYAMFAMLILTVFAFQVGRTATATYSAELFPTEIRATSYSLTVQLLGQVTAIISPVIIGSLSVPLGGLGNAVSTAAIGPLIGAALVILYAPETKGMTLEQLEARPAAAGH
jgi:putative MFS transporter